MLHIILDGNNIWNGDYANLTKDESNERMTVVSELDFSNKWHKYENGTWGVESFEPIPQIPEPDIIQQMQEDLMNVTNLAFTLLEEVDLLKGGA